LHAAVRELVYDSDTKSDDERGEDEEEDFMPVKKKAKKTVSTPLSSPLLSLSSDSLVVSLIRSL
jgi:hypothetical protein